MGPGCQLSTSFAQRMLRLVFSMFFYFMGCFSLCICLKIWSKLRALAWPLKYKRVNLIFFKKIGIFANHVPVTEHLIWKRIPWLLKIWYTGMYVCFSRSVVSYSLRPMDCSPPGSSVHGILQARNTVARKIFFLIILFLAVLGLCCCSWTFL